MPPFSSTHKGHTQIEYLGLNRILPSMFCTTQLVHRNGASVYIYTCEGVEYRASENVTPGFSFPGPVAGSGGGAEYRRHQWCQHHPVRVSVP